MKKTECLDEGATTATLVAGASLTGSRRRRTTVENTDDKETLIKGHVYGYGAVRVQKADGEQLRYHDFQAKGGLVVQRAPRLHCRGYAMAGIAHRGCGRFKVEMNSGVGHDVSPGRSQPLRLLSTHAAIEYKG
ncbi:hypothetical protein TNCT1_34910 [Streptomyces sp. 1-11]|nr:hypothetical protein TNCT1_34910 [Streptomyces sp. 1-11]